MKTQICTKITKVVFTFVIIFGLHNKADLCSAQNTAISGGVGFPELINLGFRERFGQFQIGVSAGEFPVVGERLIDVSGVLLYHFAGMPKYGILKPWFVRIGEEYVYDKTINDIFKIGRAHV